MTIVAPSPTSVYRYYDESDLLIYVGVTGRGVRRNREHNATKTWWQFVAKQEVEHYETRAEALAREVELVTRFLPPFNTQHNPDHLKSREAYLLFAAARSQPTDWHQEARDANMRIPLDYHGADTSGRVILRSRIDHASIAAAIKVDPSQEAPRAIGFRRVGKVYRVEKAGPLALIHLSSSKGHPLYDCWAFLKFGDKQRHLVIKHITVQMDHSDPSVCNKKCPTRQPHRRAA